MPKVVVNDASFEGKTDPTQYSNEDGVIYVKSSYDTKEDPEGWMVHEYKHSEMRNVPDDGKEYPTNNIESEAYKAQFKFLAGRGKTLQDIQDPKQFPTLAPKFTKYNGEYAPILIKYWNEVNGKDTTDSELYELDTSVDDQIKAIKDKYGAVPKDGYFKAKLASLEKQRGSYTTQSPDKAHSVSPSAPPPISSNDMEIGLAVYGNGGYKIIKGNDNADIMTLLKLINPMGIISRGSSFSPIVKSNDKGIGVTVPIHGEGAGGAVPFVSLVVYGNNNKSILKQAADSIISSKIVQGNPIYGLNKISNLLEFVTYNSENFSYEKQVRSNIMESLHNDLKNIFFERNMSLNESSGISSSELKQNFPEWGTKKSKSGGHGTQRSNTVSTYNKVIEWLNGKFSNLHGKKILDLSAGMGVGTGVLKSTGADVESSEPFPPSGFTPNYGFSNDVTGNSYDIVINSVVLNVVPIDIRTQIVNDIGRALKDGGVAVITARSYADVMSAATNPQNTVINKDAGEVYIKGSADFQKGFKNGELYAYVSGILGSGFTILDKRKARLGVSPEAVVVYKGKEPSTEPKPEPEQKQSIPDSLGTSVPTQTSIFESLRNDLRQIFTEGMVKVPVDEIRAWVDTHIEEFKAKLSETLAQGYNTDIEDYLIIENPYNNEKIEFVIAIQKSMLKWKGSNLIFLVDANTNTITINATRFIANYKNNIKDGLISGLVHELTHAIDPGYSKKDDTGDNYDDYVNSDKEYVAYNREFIDRIKHMPPANQEKILDRIRKGKPLGVKEIDDYYSSLTPENKTKFINQLYKELHG